MSLFTRECIPSIYLTLLFANVSPPASFPSCWPFPASDAGSQSGGSSEPRAVGGSVAGSHAYGFDALDNKGFCTELEDPDNNDANWSSWRRADSISLLAYSISCNRFCSRSLMTLRRASPRALAPAANSRDRPNACSYGTVVGRD